jgi:hypothetical protein
MLDGFTLRVEHAGFKVHVNFGFHLLLNKTLLKKQLLE